MEGSVAAYLLIMGNKPKQIMEQESTCVFFFVIWKSSCNSCIPTKISCGDRSLIENSF